MIILIAVLASLVVSEAVAILAAWRYCLQLQKDALRLWQHIEDLEADKRALTESLCRAEGKPFIPVKRAEKQASEGWFDAKPEITVVK